MLSGGHMASSCALLIKAHEVIEIRKVLPTCKDDNGSLVFNQQLVCHRKQLAYGQKAQ